MPPDQLVGLVHIAHGRSPQGLEHLGQQFEKRADRHASFLFGGTD
jgi:hypothetical protein